MCKYTISTDTKIRFCKKTAIEELSSVVTIMCERVEYTDAQAVQALKIMHTHKATQLNTDIFQTFQVCFRFIGVSVNFIFIGLSMKTTFWKQKHQHKKTRKSYKNNKNTSVKSFKRVTRDSVCSNITRPCCTHSQ